MLDKIVDWVCSQLDENIVIWAVARSEEKEPDMAFMQGAIIVAVGFVDL